MTIRKLTTLFKLLTNTNNFSHQEEVLFKNKKKINKIK